MKLTQSEIHAALRQLVDKIEACGASPELTAAVILAGDIKDAVGNEHNPASPFAANQVRKALGLPEVPVTPEDAKAILVRDSKAFRKDLDDVLQRMKARRDELAFPGTGLPDGIDDPKEVVPNLVLSIRHVEDAIMRQGMFLKAVGNPNPYPTSYDPASPKVEPTADGLKM